MKFWIITLLLIFIIGFGIVVYCELEMNALKDAYYYDHYIKLK